MKNKTIIWITFFLFVGNAPTFSQISMSEEYFDANQLGVLAQFEMGTSIPSEDLEAYSEGSPFHPSLKLGLGIQMGHQSCSFSWRHVNYPSESASINGQSYGFGASDNVFALEYDGFIGKKLDMFHFNWGIIWGNNVEKKQISIGNVSASTKVKVKYGAGFRIGCGYARQLMPQVRLTADGFMDCLGISSHKDSFTQRTIYDADAILFHLTIGAHICLSKDWWSKLRKR